MPRDVDVGSNRGVVVLCIPTISFRNEGCGCFLCGGKAGWWLMIGSGSEDAQNLN